MYLNCSILIHIPNVLALQHGGVYFKYLMTISRKFSDVTAPYAYISNEA